MNLQSAQARIANPLLAPTSRRQLIARRFFTLAVTLLTIAAAMLFALPVPRTSAAVVISSFKAQSQGNQVRVTWTTATELTNVGFNILRSTSSGGSYTKINANLIPSQCIGCVTGASYSYTDSPVSAGQIYFYKLESVDGRGGKQQYGPVSTGAATPTATLAASPTSMRTYTPAPSATPLRTNTPVPPGSTLTRVATLTPVPQSAATQPTPLTKVAIAVTGSAPSPVRPPSGTRVALSGQPSPQAVSAPSPAAADVESPTEEDTSENESSESTARGANLRPLASITVFGLAGMFGCGSLFFAALACLLFVRATRRS